ncbi:MAG: tetratricopeptide repeat protein [Hyphomicrobiales bacterium]|nr:tetratricopeptide repeat protein [Hyphomicrobiales bacterium]
MPTIQTAMDLHRRGRLDEAAARYRQILRTDPAHPEALFQLAQLACQQGRFREGVELARQAAAGQPQRARSHVLLGRALAELGELSQALASLERAIACEPDHADAYGHRGDVLARLGRLTEAVESYRRSLAIEPGAVENWSNLGAAEAELGRHAQALAAYDRALAIEPGFADAHFNRATVLVHLAREDEALASLERGLALAPDHVPALVTRGDLLRAQGHPDQALASYDRALALAPQMAAALTGRAAALVALRRLDEALSCLDLALRHEVADADVFSNRAYLLHALGRQEEALSSVERALAISPNHLEALINRVVVLAALGRHLDALASCERALAIAPGQARVHCNRAKLLLALARDREALAAAEQALALDADHVESLYTRGFVLSRLGHPDAAIAAFERVLLLAPGHHEALAQLTIGCQAICAWDKFAAAAGRLVEAVASGSAIVPPGALAQIAAAPELVLAAARRFVQRAFPAAPAMSAAQLPGAPDGRIRVAYLSGDFRRHPVAYLTAELFERHDRSRFEIIGISFGPDDGSDQRARIVRALDRFHDVRATSDRDAAALIRRLGVDIAVDLSGHTDHGRPGLLCQRGAPIQVNYLGYAATMGADFIDYILADATVLPFDQAPHYAERIVHLPDCFLVNDATRAIAPATPSRAAAGLPDAGFVFCCFNNAYKISADAFAVWMRLLDRIPGSVLWLSALDRSAVDNLRRAAQAAGIDPQRLVFAPRLPAMEQHLARHRLADLFLDTPGYNAHTTAAEALWAGLPLITVIGATFAGRVAASLLRAIHLPELVVGSLAEYEALALALARDPERLTDIRRRLAANRMTAPLFDTDRFRRHIECAYTLMVERHRQGHAPHSFAVPSLDGP